MQRLARVAVRVPKMARSMGGGGGHGHATPQYTGVEAAARAYFPENYHLVYMVLGGYAVLVTASQIRSSFAKTAAVAALPAPEFPDYHTPIVVSNDIPSFGTPEWEAFIEKDPNNFQEAPIKE